MALARIAFVVALAVAALTALTGTGVAQSPEPETAPAPLPRAVTDRLPEDPQQRHPWVPNDAPLPLNMTYAVGSYDNLMKGVTCVIDVATENPNWRSEEMRYTEVSGGVRCNLQVASITGYVRALSWSSPFPLTPDGTELARASFGTQHAVPPGHGVGWQAYATAGFTRASDQSNQVVHTHVTIELPLRTGSRWNNPGPSCTQTASTPRFVTCDVYSSPYRHAPYPCPTGKAGFQPGGCASQPQPCPSGQIGIQPSCTTPPTPDELDRAAGDLEEDNDNYADDAFPDGTPPPQPDPETEADYAACGHGDDESSCLDDAPATAETQEAGCAPTCDAFYVGAQTQPQDVPEWVRDLQVFRDFHAAGLEREVMFYESEVAVSSATASGPGSCPRRYVCLFRHANYRGVSFASRVNGAHYNLHDYGFGNRTSSWRNRKTAHDALMSSFEAGNRCLPRIHNSPFVGRFNDKADELDLFSSTVRCNIG